MATSTSRTCLRMPLCRDIEIKECSIPQLQDYLSNSSFTSRELAQCYLRRIELVNPRLRAVIETNPDVLEIADQLDHERKNGLVRSRLHGIPYLLKDNIATKNKMQTTAGCAALQGTIVPADARIVTLLREAGALLLGKANLSEFASMRASFYAEGYSSRGGQNRNPYNLAHHAGGSSSGSASGLAANMCAFSIGTETDGSIMFPADRNAVVGIKPTVGLTCTQGIIPEAPSMDTVGPFGRSVEDAVIILDLIREKAAILENEDLHVQPVLYTSSLSTKDALVGARFGMPWKRVWEAASQNSGRQDEYNSLMKLIRKIEQAGAQVFKVDFPSAEEIISPDGWDWSYADGKPDSKLSEFTVVRTEFYRSLQSHLSQLSGHNRSISSLEDIVAYNIHHTAQEGGVPGTHPAWPTGQDNFDQCIESKDWPEDVYLKALKNIRRKSRDEGIDAALQYNGSTLDGLLVPLQADGGVACSVAAKAGYPMITIPVDVNKEGIPFGIGIIQTAMKEHQLIKYGSAIEELIGGRKLPQFLNLDCEDYLYVGQSPESSSMT